MNERIKELCEQSKVYADQCTKEYTGDEPVGWMDYYTEKFAELIIRECANWIEEATDDSGDGIGDSFYWAPRLLKHFGVQE